MKKLLIYSTLILFSSCTKEVSQQAPTDSAVKEAKEFTTLLTSHTWQISDYFANEPFAYTDTSGPETDLRKYIASFLVDDRMTFEDDFVYVDQDHFRFGLDTAQLLTRPYKIGAVGNAVQFDFMDFQYRPLTYILEEIGNDYFILSAIYNEHTVKTRYKVIL